MIKKLRKRLLQISYDNKLSHIGSCLTALDIIYKIYRKMGDNDKFILSSGHAGLALYVVLEHFYGYNAEELLHKHGIHPCKDSEKGIICSTGSLGQGITVGIGHAIANSKNNVYVLCSDGEAAEGSFMESLRFLEENKQIKNIVVYINYNGYGAYKKVERKNLEYQLFDLKKRGVVKVIDTRNSLDRYESVLNGLSAHYKTLTEKDYKEICSI